MSTRLRGGVVTVLVVSLLALAAFPQTSRAEDGSPRSPEYLIKAAYLYNFAMFVGWPADAFATPESPIVIGIVGPDPFGWAIDRTVQDKRIGKRRIVIERLHPNQDARHCHLLFIGPGDARLLEAGDRLRGVSTLVVADADSGGRRSTINFVVKDNKVGFEVNLEQAKRARLTISSKLLNLAQSVR